MLSPNFADLDGLFLIRSDCLSPDQTHYVVTFFKTGKLQRRKTYHPTLQKLYLSFFITKISFLQRPPKVWWRQGVGRLLGLLHSWNISGRLVRREREEMEYYPWPEIPQKVSWRRGSFGANQGHAKQPRPHCQQKILNIFLCDWVMRAFNLYLSKMLVSLQK